MISRGLLFTAVLCLFLNLNAQQTSVDSWKRIMQTINLSESTLIQECSNFPKLNTDNSSFAKNVSDWEKNYPDEVDKFWNLQAVKEGNPSHYYLGLHEKTTKVFEHRWWQWVVESKITDRKLNEICPHFPKPVKTGNEEIDFTNYDTKFTIWSYIYPLEYESLINAEELVALNPFYEEYVVASVMPKFIGAHILTTKPAPIDSEANLEEKLKYELSLQNWYFVFQNNSFEKQYGFYPRFLDTFDKEEYIRIFTEGAKLAEEKLKEEGK